MNISVSLKNIKGNLKVIPSKSYAHRALIAAAISDAPTFIDTEIFSEDIKATVECIKALGAEVIQKNGGLEITPLKEKKDRADLFCSESGTTARLILPLASVVAKEATISGAGRLPERPMDELINVLSEHGVSFLGNKMPITLKNSPSPGEYRMKGNISSQYISGILYMLPLLSKESEIVLTTPLESRAYVDMTLEIMSKFSIKYAKKENGFLVSCGKYISPGTLKIEADWSNAAFFVVANELGADINIENLNTESIQGDSIITKLLNEERIDASQIPDLVPILAVLACSRKKDTVIYNAKRLRIKESDRLYSVTCALNAIGAEIEEKEDGLIIHGKGTLSGGKSQSYNDHRIVMSLAIASMISDKPVVIENAEAVRKSYPLFFDELKKLGGEINVI